VGYRSNYAVANSSYKKALLYKKKTEKMQENITESRVL